MALPRTRQSLARARYLVAAGAVVVLVGAIGWFLSLGLTGPGAVPLSTAATEERESTELARVFSTAVGQMQRGNYGQALDLWHRALLINPDIPEIKVNMGFTLFELERYETAREFFIGAMEQNAYQANAYYGLALTSEKMGDLEGALGAMRSYIHLAAADEDQRFVRRARSALWEWESKLAVEPADDSASD